VIFLALLGGLAAAKKRGPAVGVLATYLLYIAYGVSPPLGVAAAATLLAYARGIAADKLTTYALAITFAKFLLLPYALGRPMPYYEALWYAAGVNQIWKTYAPLTYLPAEPPLQLAVEGTLFVAGASALAARALADVVGRQAILWPLLSTEPLWFGQAPLSIPLAWTAAYYAAKRRHVYVAAAVALATGFHIYGGVLAALLAALHGARWVLLLAPLVFATPHSWVLFDLVSRIPGADPLQLLIIFQRTPTWLVKTGVEAAVLVASALTAGRTQIVAWLGIAGAALAARAPEEFAGFVYRHFIIVLPFAKPSPRLRLMLTAAAFIPYTLQVYNFGLSWEWALKYAEAFAKGEAVEGPIERAYREAYG